MTPWTTPADIYAETERLWLRGNLLATVLERLTKPLQVEAKELAELSTAATSKSQPSRIEFPYRLRLRRPKASEFGPSFDAVRAWIRSIEAASRAETGTGFDINWEEVNTRQLGRNRLPAELIIPTVEDAFGILNRRADAEQFSRLAEATLIRFPMLAAWVARKPLALLDYQADWAQILDCLAWFVSHPMSGLFPRQIDVPGVQTKFIEARKVLLAELLDVVLPADAIEHSANGAQKFEARYGLAERPAQIRFRLLDPRMAIAGFTDLTVPATEFATLSIAARCVFVVENEVTGLSFPMIDNSILIFGGGYAVERLATAAWIGSTHLIYWGDSDTHGFAILDRLRGHFPKTQSLLMDRTTLLAHRAQWNFEAVPHIAELPRLNSDERSVYDSLRHDRFGSGVRLEQEHVLFCFACSAIDRLSSVSCSGPLNDCCHT